jgi:hypothetical protein
MKTKSSCGKTVTWSPTLSTLSATAAVHGRCSTIDMQSETPERNSIDVATCLTRWSAISREAIMPKYRLFWDTSDPDNPGYYCERVVDGRPVDGTAIEARDRER